MHQFSVLQGAVVQQTPFPYAAIHPVYSPEDYWRFERYRMGIETILAGRPAGDNQRYDLSAVDLLPMDLPKVWKAFVEYHVSPNFWHDILKVFGPHIRTLYPDIDDRFGMLENIPVGVRGINQTPIVLDCQIGINTSRVKKARVRGPHVDNSKEIFACMYYMRDRDDKAPGGDLVVYEPKDWSKQLIFHGKAELHDHEVVEHKVIPYRANQAFAWINCPHAIHGVTERPIGAPPRLLVNVIAEFNERIFRTQRDHK